VSGEISGTDAELVKVGTGTLKLTHANNTYSLATILDAGILDVAALGAAGPGLISFDSSISGTHATLKIENAALSSHAFGNLVFNFAAGDKIDLPGLKFVSGAKAIYDTGSGLLTVKSGKVTDTLTLQGPDPGTFKAKDDGHGGTKVVLVPPPAKPAANAAIAETKSIEHQSDVHHASRAADNFEFTNLAGFAGLDRAWTPGFHFGPEHDGSPLNAGDGEGGWSEPTQMDFGHHMPMLSGHDFFL
jgi:autotransporter-associated beta strand protein